MTCWCIGPVNKRFGSVKLAVLLSIALHAAIAWWVHQTTRVGFTQPKQSLAFEQRLLVQLLPLAKASSATPTALSSFVSSNSARQTRPKERPKLTQSSTGTHAFSLETMPLPAASHQVPVEPQTGAALVAPPLKLDLGRTALNADRDRRRTSLAPEVEASGLHSARSNQASAFSRLSVEPSGIAAEAVAADGSRLVRFSRGGCMHLPNPAARLYDDSRKPMMANC